MFKRSWNVGLLVAMLLAIISYCESQMFVPPAKYCDPAIYDKFVKSPAEALRKLLKTDQKDQVKKASADIVDGLRTALYENIEIPKNIRASEIEEYKGRESQDLLSAKACSGLGALYLTCSPGRSVCVCQNTFPFNTTLQRGQCYAQPGSICGIDASFELPCVGDLQCTRDGVGDTRYCGGMAEFQKLSKEEADKEGLAIRTISEPTIILFTVLPLLLAR